MREYCSVITSWRSCSSVASAEMATIFGRGVMTSRTTLSPNSTTDWIRKFARKHLVEHHPQREDVRPVVHDGRFLHLLRRHIMGRAHHPLLPGERLDPAIRVQQFGDPIIRYLHAALFVEEDVLRLDVAMDDA